MRAYLKENRTAIDTWCATRKGIFSTPKSGNSEGGNPKGDNSKGGNLKGGDSKGGNRNQKRGKHANTANGLESSDTPDVCPYLVDGWANVSIICNPDNTCIQQRAMNMLIGSKDER
jgi:hypothetical protein